MLERLGHRIESVGVARLAAAVVAGGIAVAVIDVITGPDIAFSFFYALPVSLLAWRFGKRVAVSSSVLAAFIWFVIDYTTGAERPWVVPAWNALIRVAFFITIALLLVGLKVLLARQTELSRTDPLTNLLNRRAFTELAEREFARVHRTREPLTVATFDLDDFKSINDTFGHAAGDDALQAVARTIGETVRSTDLTGRLGGDEFVVVLLADGPAASIVLERLRDRVAATRIAGRALSCSIGAWTCHAGTFEAALAHADRNLYAAKQHGKGRLEISVSD